MKKTILILFSFLLLISGFGCSKNEANRDSDVTDNPHSQTEFLMGTIVNVKVFNKGKKEVLDEAFNRIRTLANQITDSEEDMEDVVTEVDLVNEKAGISPVTVSDDIFTLIKAGKNYSEKSEGSFDISILPLTNLWRIGFDDARKPEQWEIDEVLPLIDYKKIQINEEEKTVYLEEKGMALDLGGIAKGFITDEVVEVLLDAGVTSAIVDLGGNIYVLGQNPSGKDWVVGIQDPFAPRGHTVGKLPLSNKSIVTSGIYERYIEVDGVKYHHLLNPKDGYPFENGLAGVTIISDKSIDGDALSTLVFSKGLADGMAFVESLDDVEAIFITKDKTVYITSGLKDKFTLTNEQFTIVD